MFVQLWSHKSACFSFRGWCDVPICSFVNHCQIFSRSELNSLWSPNTFAEGFVSKKIPSWKSGKDKWCHLWSSERQVTLQSHSTHATRHEMLLFRNVLQKFCPSYFLFFLPACIDLFGVREQKFWSLICLHLLSLTSSFQPNHPLPNPPPTSCILSSFSLPPVIFVSLSSPVFSSRLPCQRTAGSKAFLL